MKSRPGGDEGGGQAMASLKLLSKGRRDFDYNLNIFNNNWIFKPLIKIRKFVKRNSANYISSKRFEFEWTSIRLVSLMYH